MSLWQTTYSLATRAAHPAIHWLLGWRESKGKEDPDRLSERFGYADRPRPAGKLVWLHAASVGEVMSTLLLLEKLAATFPQTHFLVTSGTVTSARLLATRLPPRTFHQYVPVDVPQCVERFIAHWRPDLALWVESELWPNLLAALRRHAVPAALLNARLSAKSLRNWRLAPGWIREMLAAFILCLSQTSEGQVALQKLGARAVTYCGNLKGAALPLPDDDYGRAKLAQMIGSRPVWLFASTHPGEEELALAAHRKLQADFPGILTIIVPRHPGRAGKILALVNHHGHGVAQRSNGHAIDAHTEIYLADTLGELGLFYRLAPVAIVGGSYTPVGGHNPIEPALLGTAVGFGPHMENFSEVAAAMLAAAAAVRLDDAAAIAAFVANRLNDSATREKQTAAAHAYAMAQSTVHDRVIAALDPLLKRAGLS